MRIGFIGVGNMGRAMIHGIIKAKTSDLSTIFITNRTLSKLSEFENYELNCVATSEQVLANSDIIILAIKPQDYALWLSTYQHLLLEKTIVSIAAGITSEFLAKYTQNYCLTMPNTPVTVGLGVTGIVINPELSSEVISEIKAIFSGFSQVVDIEEKQLPQFIALAGSSPAYFFQMIAAMASEIKLTGYTQDELERIIAQVMLGSAKLRLSSQDSAEQLTTSVCSPGGPTQEAITYLLQAQFTTIINQAMQVCIARAQEMSSNEQN